MNNQPILKKTYNPQIWVGPGILITLIALTGLISYSKILNNFFLSDDFVLIALLKELGPFGLWVNQQHGQSLFFRPVLNLISFLDYQLWQTQPWGYHLTNLIFHGLNGLWVGLIARFLTGNLQIDRPFKQFLPYLAGFIFLLLPSHSEPVSWISARTDVISTGFGLVSFVTYLSYKHTRRPSWLFLSLSLFLGGLLSKESLVTYPGLIFLYEGYGLGSRKYQRRIFRTGLINFAFYLVVLGVYLVLRFWKLGEWIGGYGEDIHLNFNPGQVLQNLVIYPTRTFIPPQFGSNLGLWVILLIGLILLSISCGILCIWRRPGSAEIPKLQGFLVLAFGIIVLPAITVSVSTWDTQGERYLYFASAFAAIHLGIILIVLCLNVWPKIQLALVISSGVLLWFGLSLYQVNQNWAIASQLSQNILTSVQNLPQDVVLITSLPDNYRGAYIYRTGLIQALSLLDQSNRFNVQFQREITDQGIERVGFYTDQIQIIMHHSIDLPDDQVTAVIQPSNRYQLQLSNPQTTFLAWKKDPLVTPDYEVIDLRPGQYILQLKNRARAKDLVIYSAGELLPLQFSRTAPDDPIKS
ncbi:MAG: hypothetical protein HC920_06055 [Oscillatoriales cyanobacterium SM2_3_0]|nr:hypothetical protein [Oscillatoriales cyanobacterium SM2_3_0]